MPSRPSDPASDYLQTASNASLESYELSRLNHAANLRREIAVLIDQLIDEMVQAALARTILEDRVLRHSTLRGEALAPQRQLPFEVPAGADIATLHGTPPMKLSRRNAKKSAA